MTKNIASTPTTVIALRYDGTGAPHVTAQGEGYMAPQIMKVAAEHGIPLYEDKNLASLLSKIELSAEIPTNLCGSGSGIGFRLYAIRQNPKTSCTEK